MLKCKILIKLCVLNCVFMCCVYGDAIQAEVLLLCLLVVLYCSAAARVKLLTSPLSLKSRSISFTFGHGSVSVGVSTSRCCRF